jgi:hypothetical protein
MVADGIRHIPLLESYSGLNTAVSMQYPGSRRLTNKVWADSSNLSAHVRFGGTILSVVRLGLIN